MKITIEAYKYEDLDEKRIRGIINYK